MVLNRISDSENFKQQQNSIMETSTTTGRRWNSVSGITHHRESIINVAATSGQRLPTFVEPTTHQKVHRIIEEHKTKRPSKSSSSSSSCNLPDYLVASRGFFAIRENSKDCSPIISSRRKNHSSDLLVNGREDTRGRINSKSSSNWERRREDRSSSRSRSFKNKSAKEGLGAIPPGKIPADGILKKSTTLVYKSGDKEILRAFKKSAIIKASSYQTLNTVDVKRDSRIHFNNNNSNINNNNPRAVKKSVSFSSDTSFVAKRLPTRKPAVHEAKVYHKGVLRDIKNLELPIKKPEIKENMNQLLLKAAHDADELALSDIISRIQRSNLESINVNLTDTSGRTAISYMAGNGATELLEMVLNFPGADIDVPDNEGNTPLHFAAQAGQAECLNILLQKCTSIKIDARNILGFTPLMKAALQGRTKCAKVLLFAGANPTLRDHGRGYKAEQWARFCGRHVCADVIERFTRHRLMEKTSCRWGSEPELAAKVLQGKVLPVPFNPVPVASSGLKSKLKRVFRNVGSDKSFSLVSQLTNAALCASSPALPKPGDSPVKNFIKPLNIPQLRVTLVAPLDILDKCELNYADKLESASKKPPRSKKKTK